MSESEKVERAVEVIESRLAAMTRLMSLRWSQAGKSQLTRDQVLVRLVRHHAYAMVREIGVYTGQNEAEDNNTPTLSVDDIVRQVTGGEV